MDFVSDILTGGLSLRGITIVDNFTKAPAAIEARTLISGRRVIWVLGHAIEVRGKSQVIVTDSRPESASRLMWASKVHLKSKSEA